MGLKTYTLLTKPGIMMGNLVTTASAFVLGSRGTFDPWLFAFTLVGLGGVIASACVFNNYLDRKSDALMERTKNRPLVKGMVSGRNALIFASLLFLFGMMVLMAFTNAWASAAALAGFLVYVGLYTVLKPFTHYSTLIGSIAGAMPPVVGYCAASGRFDIAAGLLLLILVLWQMPHFYSIAVYHYDDYKAASIPVLPITRGIGLARGRMMQYIVAFIGTGLLFTYFGYTGGIFLTVALVGGMMWLALCVYGFFITNDKLWGRRMFFVSLGVVMALCFTMAWDAQKTNSVVTGKVPPVYLTCYNEFTLSSPKPICAN